MNIQESSNVTPRDTVTPINLTPSDDDKVQLSCGHCFERSVAEAWLSRSQTCLVCPSRPVSIVPTTSSQATVAAAERRFSRG